MVNSSWWIVDGYYVLSTSHELLVQFPDDLALEDAPVIVFVAV